MHDKLQSAYLVSTIVESFYEKLREFCFLNDEDNPEYYMIINKLKKAIVGEESIYDELSNQEVNLMLDKMKTLESKNPTQVRIYGKLLRTNRKRNTTNFNIDLSDIITSKIIIDTLKRLTLKIIKFSETEIGNEYTENLLMYNQIYKYIYLTGNSYIEKLALQYDFDILSLPDISFSEIEKSFSNGFIDAAANLTLGFIVDCIKELLGMKTDDKCLNMYITLFEVSRVEVMLPYLTKDTLDILSQFLHQLNITDENSAAIIKIKNLVEKRKKELS